MKAYDDAVAAIKIQKAQGELPPSPKEQVSSFKGSLESFAEDPFEPREPSDPPPPPPPPIDAPLPVKFVGPVIAPLSWAERKRKEMNAKEAAGRTGRFVTPSPERNQLPSPRSRGTADHLDGSINDTSDDSDRDTRTLPLISPRQRKKKRIDMKKFALSPGSDDRSKDDNRAGEVAAALQANQHGYLVISTKDMPSTSETEEFLKGKYQIFRPSLVSLDDSTQVCDYPSDDRFLSQIISDSSSWYIFFQDGAGARRSMALKASLEHNGKAIIPQLKKVDAPKEAQQTVPKALERALPPHLALLQAKTVKEVPVETSIVSQLVGTKLVKKRDRAVVESESEHETSDMDTKQDRLKQSPPFHSKSVNLRLRRNQLLQEHLQIRLQRSQPS